MYELSLNEEINIYINSGMTPTELFILRLVFLAIDGDQKYLINYLSNTNGGKDVFRAVLQSLKDKKLINNTFKVPCEGDTLNFNNIPFNKVFLKNYIRESNEIGKEFFDAYPSFISIGGKPVSIRNFTKAGLFSFEDFCLFYAKSIKSSNTTHERVMEAVRFGKEAGLINYSIIEFIASRKYEEIDFIKESDNINGYQNSELL